LFAFLAVLPLLLLGVALGYKRHLDKLAGNVAYARSRGANRIAMKRLSKAKSLLAEPSQKEFYAEISHALIGFAADKLNLSSAGIMTSELAEQLAQRKVQPELLAYYMKLLQVCDFQRFALAEVSKEEMQKIYTKAESAIINLEKAF
jgi:hypothetical protein